MLSSKYSINLHSYGTVSFIINDLLLTSFTESDDLKLFSLNSKVDVSLIYKGSIKPFFDILLGLL